MIRAVIFDFDGLILDTETYHYQILQEIFQEHDCHLPLPVWQKVIGTQSDFRPFDYLEEQIKRKVDQGKLKLLAEERFQERIAKEEARPGVAEYLEAAKELGLKIALATSSDYGWVSRHLKMLRLYEKFECIRTSDHVEKVKPDPSLYLQAAECLDVKPEECLVFEDSVNGALAAERAGMRCVVIPNEVTKDLEFGKVNHRLESMAEIELAELIKLLS